MHGGRTPTGLDAVEWVVRAAELGAGEIMLTSMDRDGTRDGYDLELTRTIRGRWTCRSSPRAASARSSTLRKVFWRARPMRCWRRRSSTTAGTRSPRRRSTWPRVGSVCARSSRRARRRAATERAAVGRILADRATRWSSPLCAAECCGHRRRGGGASGLLSHRNGLWRGRRAATPRSATLEAPKGAPPASRCR